MTTRSVQFRPLPTWPGKATVNRRNLSGEQTYTKTIERLEKELSHLSAQNIVIQTGHQARDIRQDGWLRSDAKVPTHPGVLLHFESKLVSGGKAIGSLRFACDSYRDWKDNLRAIVLTLDSLRAIERHGAVQSAEQYKGFAGVPTVSKPPAPQTSSDSQNKALSAAQVLCYHAHTDASATPAQPADLLRDPHRATSIFRSAAHFTHPDKPAGSASAFRQVKEAKDVLDAYHKERGIN